MASKRTLLTQLQAFLDKQGIWHNPGHEGWPRGFFTGQSGQYHWDVHLVGGASGLLMFLARCPVNVPEDRRLAAAQYLVQTNWNVNFGNFEMNWDDGQVVFRTSLPVTRGAISTKTLTDLVHAPLALMDKYLPGLFAAVWGDNHKDSPQAQSDTAPVPMPPNAQDTIVNSTSTRSDPPPANGTASLPVHRARVRRLFGREGNHSP